MFGIHKSDTSSVQPWEYVPAAVGEYKTGQMLNMAGGNATALSAASTSTPPYLCMADKEITEAGNPLPVIRVTPGQIFETTLSAAAATAAIGGKLQVSAGGMEASPGAGSFEIVGLDGKEVGDAVRGRFA